MASYDPSNKTIEFREIKDQNQTEMLFYHELVHAYQHHAYPNMNDRFAIEFEAHTLQNMYMLHDPTNKFYIVAPDYMTKSTANLYMNLLRDLILPKGVIRYPSVEELQDLYRRTYGDGTPNPSSPPFQTVVICSPVQ